MSRVMVFILLICSFMAMAQLNESDTARFQFRAEATGAWQQGNVELLVLRSRLELVTNSHHPLVFKTQTNSLYQEFGGRKADNDINNRNYLYWKPNRKVYPFAMLYLQTNFRRQVDSRWFTGAGGTWQIVQKPLTNMKLSASLVFERTNFTSIQFNEDIYNGSETINLWRATMYVAGWHHLFEGNLRLYYTVYWQPGLEEVDNNRAQVDAGLELPVWKGLRLLAQYTMTYEQIVVAGIRQYDRIFTFGISYQFKN